MYRMDVLIALYTKKMAKASPQYPVWVERYINYFLKTLKDPHLIGLVIFFFFHDPDDPDFDWKFVQQKANILACYEVSFFLLFAQFSSISSLFPSINPKNKSLKNSLKFWQDESQYYN